MTQIELLNDLHGFFVCEFAVVIHSSIHLAHLFAGIKFLRFFHKLTKGFLVSDKVSAPPSIADSLSLTSPS